MAHEIEVKVIDIDKKSIINKLLSLGAKETFSGHVIADFFDSSDGNLRKEKAFIRVRSLGDQSFVTYKKKISSEDTKIMEEIETSIGDKDIFISMLKELGYVSFKHLEKKRTSFVCGDVHFEIDEFAKVPAFLEIEALDEKTIFEWVEKLELKKENVKPWNGTELFEHYNITLPY